MLSGASAADGQLPRRALLQASPGRVAQRLLDAINALSRVTPALGSTAAATTDARGSATAQYRNTTSSVQQTPPRTAAVFQAGATAVDENAQRTAGSGSSASVAKRIPTETGSASSSVSFLPHLSVAAATAARCCCQRPRSRRRAAACSPPK
jgi:hypothetical protein